MSYSKNGFLATGTGSGGSTSTSAVIPVAPTKLFADSGTRANSTTLGNGWTIQTYSGAFSSGSTQFGISSNNIVFTNSATDCFAWVDVGAQAVTIDATWRATGSNGGVMLRFSSASGQGSWLVAQSNGVALKPVAGGALTNPVTFSSAFTAGDKMRVTAIGETFTFYKNGVQVGQYIDTANVYVATKFGLYGYSDTTTQFSDFAIYLGDLGATGTGTLTIPTLPIYGSPSINMPQGTQQRQYTFDNDTNGFTTDNGTLSAVGAKLRVTAANSGNASVLEPATAANVADGEMYADIYEIAQTTTPSAYNDPGVIFRATDAANHYMLSLLVGAYTGGASEFTLFKKVAGAYTALASSPSVNPGNTPFLLGANASPLRVMVRFVGSQIQAYVNETLVLAVNDTTFTTGRCGVRAGASTTQVIDFDNVSVYTLSSTWTPALYTPQSAAAAPQYVIPTLSQINYSELTISVAKTITNQQWSLIPFDAIVSDPNSLFNTTTSIYTVPATGTYAVGLTFRSDAIAGSNVGLAIHTSNADSTNTVWRQDSAGTGNRHTYQYFKVAKYNAGDQLRAIAYVDVAGTTLISGATMTFEQVATAALVSTQASVTEIVNTANSTATYTIPDTAVATINNITLTANCTFTFPSANAGKSFTLALAQDGTGSRTATWPGTVKWPGGTAPTLTTTATKTDLLTFVCIDGTNWLGTLAGKAF